MEESPVHYVSTAPDSGATVAAIEVARTATALSPTVRHTVHDLRAEAEGRAWSARVAWVGGPGWRTTARVLSEAAAAPAEASSATADSADETPDDDRLIELLALLRAETTRYVYALRAAGARPEQMLVQVKAFVHAAMAGEGWQDAEAAQVLTAEVVRWSIDAYYDR